MSVAWVGAGIAAVGTLSQASAAGDAADAQARSGQASIDEQRRQYDLARADQAPFRNTGVAANNALARLMGVGGVGTSGVTSMGLQTGLSPEQVRQQLLSRFTRTTPGQGAPAGPATMDQGNSSQQMAQASMGPVGFQRPQAAAANTGGGDVGQTIDEAGLNAAIQQYYAEQGQQNSAAESDPNYGSLMRNFSASDLTSDPLYQQLSPQIKAAQDRSVNFEASPEYQFRLGEGQKAVENSAAARGGLLSGAALKAIQKYGQGFASNEYGNWLTQSNADRSFISGEGNNAYNRFNTNNTTKYNRLAGLSGTGQTATNQIQAAGTNASNGIASTMQGIGNVNAAGIVGGANALAGGANTFQSYNMMNSLLRNGGGTGYVSSPASGQAAFSSPAWDRWAGGTGGMGD